MTEPRDIELWDLWVTGDGNAGNRLFRRHFPGIYRFFRAKVGARAEDLTQQTFVACLEGAAAFRRDSTVRAYLYGIARKQLLRHFEGRHAGLPFAALSRLSMLELSGTSPSQAAAASERRDLVLEAMQRIPVDFQIVLELYYWESMSTEEIAVAVDVARGTVKSRLSRGRDMLEDVLRRQAAASASGCDEIVEQTQRLGERLLP